MCYIDAMIFKGLAIAAVLLATAQTPLSAQTTATHHPSSALQTQSPYPSPSQTQPKPDCNGAPCEEQQPHVIVTLPSPAPTRWLMHDKILWGVDLVLAILGYAGIMLALSTLKKIERHTQAFEASMEAAKNTAAPTAPAAETSSAMAAAALETAQAALLHAQAIVHAERPWVLVTAEPTRGVESSFEITATNRGRSPARVTAALDQVLFAADEAHLPETPAYEDVAPGAPLVPIILLTGESTSLKSFSRDDAVALPKTEEELRRLDTWENKIFIHGKVTYRDLIAPPDQQIHTTDWCCWYIHGRQKSGLVIAGPPQYNQHT